MREIRALVFGNDANAVPSNVLFFTAGIEGEQYGLFGTISQEDPKRYKNFLYFYFFLRHSGKLLGRKLNKIYVNDDTVSVIDTTT